MVHTILFLGLCLIVTSSARRELGMKLLSEKFSTESIKPNQGRCKPGDPTPQISKFLGAAFYGEIMIGDPGQKFLALWHTGASNTWVGEAKCRNLFCVTHSLYNNTKSTTYQKNGANFTMNYPRGFVRGYLSADTFQIDDKIVKKQSFAEIAAENGYGFVVGTFDGIVGLDRSSPLSGAPSLLDNIIQQGLLEQNIFSLHFSHKSNQGGITFGPPDSLYFAGDITYVPVKDDKKWVISIDKITFGPTKVCKCGCLAHIDTGYSVIVGPTKDIEAIHKVIGGNPIGGGEYLVPCDKISTFPKMQLVIGKTTFELEAKDYVVRLDELEGDVCFSGFKGEDNLTGNSTKWIIGDPFLREFYSVFDIDKNKIGFAKSII